MFPKNLPKKLHGVRFGITEADNGFILDLDSPAQMTKLVYVFNNVNSLTQFLTNYIEDNSL